MTNAECIVFLRNQQNEIKGWIDQVKGYAKEAAQQGIDTYDMAIKALEFVEKVQSMFNANTDDVLKLMLKALKGGSEGWIPCSESLPEIQQDVLLSLRSLDIEVGFRAETEPYFYCHNVDGCYIEPQNVLAWMPLPQPYKEVNDNAKLD